MAPDPVHGFIQQSCISHWSSKQNRIQNWQRVQQRVILKEFSRSTVVLLFQVASRCCAALQPGHHRDSRLSLSLSVVVIKLSTGTSTVARDEICHKVLSRPEPLASGSAIVRPNLASFSFSSWTGCPPAFSEFSADFLTLSCDN